jgi:hypothetical protein
MMRPANKEYQKRAAQEQNSELIRLISERAAGNCEGALKAEFEGERQKISAEQYPEDEVLARKLQEQENAKTAAPSAAGVNLEEDMLLAQKLADEDAAFASALNADAELASKLFEEEKEALARDRRQREERELKDRELAEKLAKKRPSSAAPAESPEEAPSRMKRRSSNTKPA